MDILVSANELYRSLLKPLYLHLHARPELAFDEHVTASLIAYELAKAGFLVTEGIGQTGVVGVLENGPGKTLMIRTELDALQIEEDTCLAKFNAGGKHQGLMHACGHDLHMASFIGAANLMAQAISGWSGTLVMLAQPAEERVAGARAMLQDPEFSQLPQPDIALGLHVFSGQSSGAIFFKKGVISRAVDFLEIHLEGVQGHPGTSKDAMNPGVVLTHILANLKSLDPLVKCPTPLGFTSLERHGNRAVARLSCKSSTPEERVSLIKEVCETVTTVSEPFTLAALPQVHDMEKQRIPSVFNTPEIVEVVIPRFQDVFGKAQISEYHTPDDYSEDFSLFRTELNIPSFYWGVGCAGESSRGKSPRVHTPVFLPDYKVSLPVATASFVAAAMTLLRKEND